MITKSRSASWIAALALAAAANTGIAAAAVPSASNVHSTMRQVEIPLSRIAHPRSALANLKIEDQKGDTVGTVGQVLVDGGGKAAELKVDVGNYLGMGSATKVIAMRAGDFKLDQAHNLLVTRLTKDQIHVIAGA